ncbi:hypothetical protein F5050DRAFT_1807381 [Lentinula boryana]|uniref:L-arabinokinase n=1 Tax=Lentinula boryana TaxID=40481 RepID=A0ABQ8QEI5_9AGAR|nr:hypothetical protein F5050DRAFT_1807381 [Lentinula boryana]
MASPCYVYYCSGHGFGHGTRVSAFVSQFLSLSEDRRPLVHIVSSAPSHVFGDSIALGAQYRYGDCIDPVIVQPLAYRVDRQKSIEVLKAFLKNKEKFLETEREWLTSVKARCVLSDAAFLGCLAAKAAGIPSILVTNFTFDSVYSYLATDFIDEHHSIHPSGSLSSPDVSVPHSLIEPLVSQIHAGYRCADLLLLLPGHIPIPSFCNQTSLPATDWVDLQENDFLPEVLEHLSRLKEDPSNCTLHNHIPFPPTTALARKSASVHSTRKVIPMPLLVRPPSSTPERSPYTLEGRARILGSANVPSQKHDPETTKILVVSFGGQVLKWPASRTYSSAVTAQIQSEERDTLTIPKIGLGINLKTSKALRPSHTDIPSSDALPCKMQLEHAFEIGDHREIDPQPMLSPRLATPSHIWIPGAPAVVNPLSPSISSPKRIGVAQSSPYPERAVEKRNESKSGSPIHMNADTSTFHPLIDMINMPVSPRAAAAVVIPTSGGSRNENFDGAVGSGLENMYSEDDEFTTNETEHPQLLPDSSWIAIVCGASDEQRSDTSALPENFYLAPKDVYMPDLTAIADVLLGKLGYGTVAECIDAGTPMVYVSRPLFIEELGLRVLLKKEGVGVEMSRLDYEGGRWVESVKEAWEKARVAKEWKRRVERGEKKEYVDKGITEREAESRYMAKVVVDWVEDWWQGI